MIYTVTLNPSLDYIIKVDRFQFGRVNRASSETIRAGGKGINVSLMLQTFNVDNRALGFIAGFTGRQIRESMKAAGCTTGFVELEHGFSRVNVKMNSMGETEINGAGPTVSVEEMGKMIDRIAEMVREDDTIVLSGSIPQSLPQDTYEQILEKIDTDVVNVVVDTNGNILRRLLCFHPFLIKPNLQELSEMFSCPLKEYDEIVGCAHHLQEEGARNVLVSMGEDGAILVTENGQVFSAPAPKGEVVDSTGAGDAMIAGFLAGYLERGSLVDGFYMGLVTASATVFREGLATREEVRQLEQVQ